MYVSDDERVKGEHSANPLLTYNYWGMFGMENMKETKNENILILCMGRKGAGAKQTLETVRAFTKRQELNIYVALSKENELLQDTCNEAQSSFVISTFPNYFGLLCNVLKIPVYKNRFKEFVKKNNIDLVYCPMSSMFDKYLKQVLKKLNIPYVITVHDAVRHLGEENKNYERNMQLEIDNAACVITHSNSVNSKVLSIYRNVEEKAVCVPIGSYDYGIGFERELKPNRIRLLFLGRIVAYKGLQIAIDSLDIIQNHLTDVNVTLEIAGSGDISEYKISNDHIILNNRWIAEEEIPEIINRNDILLLPYICASQSGLVPIAVSCGMPVVATNVDGLGEQVKNAGCGILVKEASAESIANAVIELHNNPQKYSQLSREGLTAAKKKMSWDIIVEDLINNWKQHNLI